MRNSILEDRFRAPGDCGHSAAGPSEITRDDDKL